MISTIYKGKKLAKIIYFYKFCVQNWWNNLVSGLNSDNTLGFDGASWIYTPDTISTSHFVIATAVPSYPIPTRPWRSKVIAYTSVGFTDRVLAEARQLLVASMTIGDTVTIGGVDKTVDSIDGVTTAGTSATVHYLHAADSNDNGLYFQLAKLSPDAGTILFNP